MGIQQKRCDEERSFSHEEMYKNIEITLEVDGKRLEVFESDSPPGLYLKPSFVCSGNG